MIFERSNNQTESSASDPKYTVTEVAELLAVSRQSIYRQIASGRLDCYWVGSSIRVAKRHLDAYLSGNTNGARKKRMAEGK